MTEDRQRRFRGVLARRQPDLTVLLDKVHKPHNIAAIMRSCDATGIGTVHAVPLAGNFRPPRHVAQGTQKWVEVRRHESFEMAARTLRNDGFSLYAAHLSDHAMDFRQVDYTGKVAVVFGQEKLGLENVAADDIHVHIVIPMRGMVRSLNVSVAAALILYEAERQRTAAGLYDQQRIEQEEYHRLLFEWTQPKVAEYCRRHGMPYPALDDDGGIIGQLPEIGVSGNR
ncbi:MAG: tRNA (guanosine(18)-2'-O)-methyltransferase TrmH [Gammaproteobacteria bacterium]|nr:MAG: tRNA (guanosine(18)-2'-O)-methyltransferase TrmH [Gammaproteobacteria bacterium]